MADNSCHAFELGCQVAVSVGQKMAEEFLVTAAEVGLVPFENARDDQAPLFGRDDARPVDVVPRRDIEQVAGIGRGKGVGQQVRAAQSRAVDGVMSARLALNWPQNAVFDVVQADRLAADDNHFLVPRPDGEQAR